MIVVSLFDESGNMCRPWYEAGHECYCFDIKNKQTYDFMGSGSLAKVYGDLTDKDLIREIVDMKPDIIFGFPPCTDLASSGARWWKQKHLADPDFQSKAATLAQTVFDIAVQHKTPYMIENPVGRLSYYFGKPQHVFDPYEFGGYLPTDDKHPRWPNHIPPRDAYPKRTCIWSGYGFKFPERKPVPMDLAREANRQSKLGGKSEKTKEIRSETPRGFAVAVYEANS